MEMLIKNGADINKTNNDGNTVIITLAEKNDTETILYFLELNEKYKIANAYIDFDQANKQGKTFLSILHEKRKKADNQIQIDSVLNALPNLKVQWKAAANKPQLTQPKTPAPAATHHQRPH
jgi:ankyrin repeat protein